MKKLHSLQLPGIDPNLQALFNQIRDASQAGDVTDLGGAFTINGIFTPTRTLNVTGPTLANVVAVVATLLADLKAGGASRTT